MTEIDPLVDFIVHAIKESPEIAHGMLFSMLHKSDSKSELIELTKYEITALIEVACIAKRHDLFVYELHEQYNNLLQVVLNENNARV